MAPISSTLNPNVTSLLDTTGQTATNVASTADTGNLTKTGSDVTSLLDTGATDLTTSKGPGTTVATTDTGAITKTLTDLGNVVNPNITSLLDVYPADGEDATGVTGDFGMGEQAAAKEQLASGKSIQGWTMRIGRKTKFWKDEALVQEAFKDLLIAWELKSPSAVLKLGVEVSEDLVGEKVAASSLVRSKE